MKILISGTSKGIGKAVATYFLDKGYEVVGLDKEWSTISHKNYTHHMVDLTKKSELPSVKNIDYIFSNAGLQNSEDDIDNNLKSTINLVEKYMDDESLKGILFNASASARSGFEFPNYVASKAGVVGYMKNVACRLAHRKVVANSLSLGGVITDSNKVVMDDPKIWKEIMDVTPLKKWMSLKEVCEWVNFLLIVNKSASGQDFLVDNGELNLNNTFKWTK